MIYEKGVYFMMQEDSIMQIYRPTFNQDKKLEQFTIENIIFPKNGSGVSPIYSIKEFELVEYEDYISIYCDE